MDRHALEDFIAPLTERERVVLQWLLSDDFRGRLNNGEPLDEESPWVPLCEWLMQSSRSAAKAWLRTHADQLAIQYAIALLMAMLAQVEEGALRADMEWRRDLLRRVRQVGLQRALDEAGDDQ